jgi:hypothetical protein
MYDTMTVGVGLFVHVGERFGDGRGDRHRVGPGDLQLQLACPLSDLAQVAARHVFDDDIGPSVGVDGGLQHLCNTGMVHLGLDARFIQKTRQERRVVAMLVPDELDDARALGAFDIPECGQVDLTHPSARDGLEQHQPPKGSWANKL